MLSSTRELPGLSSGPWKSPISFSTTLESVIDVGQGISVGPGRFGKKNKLRALNKRRAWKIWKKEYP